MKAKLMFALTVFAIVALATSASADWFEDFDGYATGSGLVGQGGWEGWGGDPVWDAVVTDAYSRSGPNSVDITPASDVIQQFSGYTTGTVVITAWQYIPGTAVGEQYFILLDAYDHAGATNHWALQLKFADGAVESEFDSAILGLVTDAWIELNVEIDLDLDLMTVKYDGDVLVSKPYSAGTNNDFLGVPNIACLDLFSNAGDDVYWDDLSLIWLTTATEDTSWSRVKSLF